jgi:hypothetical protein
MAALFLWGNKPKVCKVPDNKPWHDKANLPHDAGVESVSGLGIRRYILL